MNWKIKKYPAYHEGKRQDRSKAAVAGNLVILSAHGQNPDTGKVGNDLEAQMATTLNNIRLTMEELGSSMNNLIKTSIFLKNGEDYSHMREIELGYYKKYAPLLAEEPPASTCNKVVSLEDPEFLVEIEAIGVVSKNKAGWEVKKYPLYYEGVKQPYSRSAVVGNLVFPSTANARDPVTGKIKPSILNDLEGQMEAVHDNIKLALKEAGSSVNNIIKTFHFLKELAPRVMWKSELEYFQKYARVLIEEDMPASTFMQLPALTSPEHLAEVEVTAVVSRNKPGWELKKAPLYYAENKRYFPKTATVGNLILCSGNAGGTMETGEVESDILEDHMTNSLARTKLALEESGSSMDNIISSLYLVKRLEDMPRVKKAELEFYKKYAPRLLEEPQVKTFIQPQSMANPKYLVEIDNIAVIPG